MSIRQVGLILIIIGAVLLLISDYTPPEPEPRKARAPKTDSKRAQETYVDFRAS